MTALYLVIRARGKPDTTERTLRDAIFPEPSQIELWKQLTSLYNESEFMRLADDLLFTCGALPMRRSQY